jgi:hypothetical protein
MALLLGIPPRSILRDDRRPHGSLRAIDRRLMQPGLSTVPVKAQLVPVVPVVPAPVYHDHDWRVQERERAYHHEQHRLRAEERDLDARRRALHEQRRHEEENGFYGR